jgi:hypothetical protein
VRFIVLNGSALFIFCPPTARSFLDLRSSRSLNELLHVTGGRDAHKYSVAIRDIFPAVRSSKAVSGWRVLPLGFPDDSARNVADSFSANAPGGRHGDRFGPSVIEVYIYFPRYFQCACRSHTLRLTMPRAADCAKGAAVYTAAVVLVFVALFLSLLLLVSARPYSLETVTWIPTDLQEFVRLALAPVGPAVHTV